MARADTAVSRLRAVVRAIAVHPDLRRYAVMDRASVPIGVLVPLSGGSIHGTYAMPRETQFLGCPVTNLRFLFMSALGERRTFRPRM